MWLLSTAVAEIFLKKAELDVRVPFAVSDPFAEVKDLAGKLEPHVFSSVGPENPQNLVSEGGGDLFVRI
jgi:hypothetical protein